MSTTESWKKFCHQIFASILAKNNVKEIFSGGKTIITTLKKKKIEKKAKANVSVMWTNFKKMPNTNSKNSKLSKIEGL